MTAPKTPVTEDLLTPWLRWWAGLVLTPKGK